MSHDFRIWGDLFMAISCRVGGDDIGSGGGDGEVFEQEVECQFV
jgi:hypothetical protein